jgi:hypothetical protein
MVPEFTTAKGHGLKLSLDLNLSVSQHFSDFHWTKLPAGYSRPSPQCPGLTLSLSESEQFSYRFSRTHISCNSNMYVTTRSSTTITPLSLRHGKKIQCPSFSSNVVKHWRRIPVRIQVVVHTQDWLGSGPHFVQVGRDVVRICGNSFLKFSNWYVSDLQLLPSLRFVCLEYLVERLFLTLSHPAESNGRIHLPWYLRTAQRHDSPAVQQAGGSERRKRIERYQSLK